MVFSSSPPSRFANGSRQCVVPSVPFDDVWSDVGSNPPLDTGRAAPMPLCCADRAGCWLQAVRIRHAPSQFALGSGGTALAARGSDRFTSPQHATGFDRGAGGSFDQNWLWAEPTREATEGTGWSDMATRQDVAS